MSIKKQYDVVVIGAGPGGLAAAIEAKKGGADDVLVIERDVELGGILLQCIHNGFGLQTFKEDLPGPNTPNALSMKPNPWESPFAGHHGHGRDFAAQALPLQ